MYTKGLERLFAPKPTDVSSVEKNGDKEHFTELPSMMQRLVDMQNARDKLNMLRDGGPSVVGEHGDHDDHNAHDNSYTDRPAHDNHNVHDNYRDKY